MLPLSARASLLEASIVSALQAAVQAVADNADASQKQLLLMNVKEARDKLSMHITEVEMSPNVGAIAPAVSETRMLLRGVDQQFGY